MQSNQPEYINRESATAKALYIIDAAQKEASARGWETLERARVHLSKNKDLWLGGAR